MSLKRVLVPTIGLDNRYLEGLCCFGTINSWAAYSRWRGKTEGLTPFVIGSPVSIAFSLEGFGYGLMGLSMLFAGFAFSGGKLERWIRRLLLLNGMQVIAVVAGLLEVWIVTMVSLIIWCISFPMVAILLAILFKKQSAAQPVAEADSA